MSPESLSSSIAIRFCPPQPAWGSPLTYAEQFIPELLQRLPEATVYSSFEPKAKCRLRIAARNPQHRRGALQKLFGLWNYQKHFPKVLHANNIKVLFCPFNNEALCWPGSIRQVFIVHDLVPILFPREFKSTRLLWSTIYRKAIERATHIICVSEATRSALVEHFRYPREKTSVVYNGFAPPPEAAVRRPEKRLLYVASAHSAHKNIDTLLRAFLRSNVRFTHKLVVVGIPNPANTPLLKGLASAADVPGSIEFLSFLGHEQLEDEYARAECLVYPSLCEGFGLPLVEAMARQVPVCASNLSAMPEICGKAALYFDPKKPESITKAMERITTDEPLKQSLTRLGAEQVSRFSWARSAEKVAEICLRVAAANESS